MKLMYLTFVAFVSFSYTNVAFAAPFACSDGTTITRINNEPPVDVTINGVPLQCEQFAANTSQCSSPSSSDQCSGRPVGAGCTTKFGENAICYSTQGTGPDGKNPDCTCSVGG